MVMPLQLVTRTVDGLKLLTLDIESMCALVDSSVFENLGLRCIQYSLCKRNALWWLIGSIRASTLETFAESDILPWMESTDQI